MEKKEKKPATFIGLSSKLTMLIVILATAVGSMAGDVFFLKCLYAFFMPMMFLNAGIIIHRQVTPGGGTWWEFIRGLLRAYIITYLLWALIYSVFSYKNFLWIVYGSKEALTNAGTLDILWLLPCMFLARLFNEIVFHIVDALPLGNKKTGCGIFMILFFVIGMILPKLPTYGYPWCINVAFVASGFMLLGFLLRDAIEIIARKPAFIIAGLVIFIALFCLGTVLRSGDLGIMYMGSAEYGNPLWFFVNAISGSMIILFLSMLLTRYWKREGAVIKAEDEAGYNRTTLGTFVIHRPLLQQVIMPLLLLIPISIPKVVIVIVSFVVTKIISGWIIKVLARSIPQLFGIYHTSEDV